MRRVVKIQLFFFIILVFNSLLPVVTAGELYVSKNLKVHTEASLESPVTHLLLGGEKVEVLRIDGDFTEVQDADEHKGWVASEFLSDIKPVDVESLPADKLSAKQASTKTNKANQKQKKKAGSSSEQTPKAAQQVKTNQNSKELLGQVQAENKQLQEQIQQIQKIINKTTTNANYSGIGAESDSNVTLWFAVGGILLGFILGYLWSDFINRKRHGGFKV